MRTSGGARVFDSGPGIGSGGAGGAEPSRLLYASTGGVAVVLESWPVAEGTFVGVSVDITLGYDDGAIARARNVFAHADARRRPGSGATFNGTSPLNDAGTAAGVAVTWSIVDEALTLSIQTSYTGNVAVIWHARVREMDLPT